MEGDEGFVALFRAEHPRLVAFGLALSGDGEIAADLAQETLARAYASWPTLAAHPNVAAWLRRVLVNAWRDRIRRQSTAERASVHLVRPVEGSSVEPSDDEWWTAVRALPERQRIAVSLHYLEDWSVAQVAAAMDVTVGTVKATLARARESLRRTLQLHEGEAC